MRTQRYIHAYSRTQQSAGACHAAEPCRRIWRNNPGRETTCGLTSTPLFAFPAGPNAARKTQHERSRPSHAPARKCAGGRPSSLPRGRGHREKKARTIRGLRHRVGGYILWWQRQPTQHIALWAGCELNSQNIEQMRGDGCKVCQRPPVERPGIRAVNLGMICSLVRFWNTSVARLPLHSDVWTSVRASR